MSLVVMEANFGREGTKHDQEGEAGKIAQDERGGKFQTPKQQNIDLFMDSQWWRIIYWLFLHQEINDISVKLPITVNRMNF